MADLRADLKANLGPYRLEEALEADRSCDDCLVFDVGRDEDGNAVESLKHTIKMVDDYLLDAGNLYESITKLYVVGDWNTSAADEEIAQTEDPGGLDHPMHEVRIFALIIFLF